MVTMLMTSSESSDMLKNLKKRKGAEVGDYLKATSRLLNDKQGTA